MRELLATNLIQGMVSLLWVMVVLRISGRLRPGDIVNILTIALLLPLVIPALKLLGAPEPDDAWMLIRVDLWVEAFVAARLPLGHVVSVLALGAFTLFVAQELAPFVRVDQRAQLEQRADPHLSAVVMRVYGQLAEHHPLARRRAAPPAVVLVSKRPVACMSGLRRPVLMVSSGLMDSLQESELESIVAHELAHVVRGGNVWRLGVWLARVPQAASPAALLLHRQLLEAQELACDARAAATTGSPAVLASALLKARSAPAPNPDDTYRQAERARVARIVESASIRKRVRALLDRPVRAGSSTSLVAPAVALLGGMLWLIG